MELIVVAVVKGSLEFLEVKIQGFSGCLKHTIIQSAMIWRSKQGRIKGGSAADLLALSC